jgi:hypothetical protein
LKHNSHNDQSAFRGRCNTPAECSIHRIDVILGSWLIAWNASVFAGAKLLYIARVQVLGTSREIRHTDAHGSIYVDIVGIAVHESDLDGGLLTG